MPTTNHQFDQPEYEAIDWHFAWYTNFEDLDTGVEVRDLEENLGNYQPKAGAKFFALDTGRIYLGDDDTWTEAPNSGGDPEYGSVTADTGTFGTVTAEDVSATNLLNLPIFGSFDEAPTETGSLIYISGEIDSEGVYRYDGESYRELAGGGSAMAGVGGEYTITGDGTTTEFRWETGIDITDTEIEWVTVDPSTDAASADFSRTIEGSEIVVEYRVPPDDGDALGWYWRAATPTDSTAESPSRLSTFEIDTDKSWKGYSISSVGSFDAAAIGTEDLSVSGHRTKEVDVENNIQPDQPGYIVIADDTAELVSASGRLIGYHAADDEATDIVDISASSSSADATTGEVTWSTALSKLTTTDTSPALQFVIVEHDETDDTGTVIASHTSLALEVDTVGGRNWDGRIVFSGVENGASLHTIALGDVTNTTAVDTVDRVSFVGGDVWHEGNFDPTAKADSPHGNEAHSTSYSAEGHDHATETITPATVSAGDVDATRATVSEAPADPTDVVRQTDLSGYYEIAGDVLQGGMNANGHSISNAGTITADSGEFSSYLSIPEVDGVPDEGNLWMRSDL